MKKSLILLILLMLTSSFVETWVTTQISSSVSVQLPNKVEKQIIDGIEVYKAANSNCKFSVTLKQLPDSIETQRNFEIYFLKGLVAGTVIASNGELLAEKTFKIGASEGIEISYTAPSEKSLVNHKRVFVVEKTLYTLDCRDLKENDKDCFKDRRKFFDSIKLKK
ncbi:MAG: hypothetical protein H7Y04_00060 [Verrucomicrobia bacterium]|nr:hypothetical protein [Cytophagales bacterium]